MVGFSSLFLQASTAVLHIYHYSNKLACMYTGVDVNVSTYFYVRLCLDSYSYICM